MFVTPKKYPKFCEYCGAKLQWSRPEPSIFDPQNGKRRGFQQLRCPQKKWYQVFHNQPHTRGFDGLGAHRIYFWKEIYL